MALIARSYLIKPMTSSAEKFEILSAYLDNEASEEDRSLVEQWIECDPSFRAQYQAQLRLKSAIRSLPAYLFNTGLPVEAHSAVRGSASEQSTHAEQPEQSFDDQANGQADGQAPNQLFIRTLFSTNRVSTKRQPVASSCTAIAYRWKDLLLVATAISATAVTAFSVSSVKRSQWGQIRRHPGRITEIDTSFWPENHWAISSAFSAQQY